MLSVHARVTVDIILRARTISWGPCGLVSECACVRDKKGDMHGVDDSVCIIKAIMADKYRSMGRV